MIILKMRGGIGNQLFQYAFGRFLAVKYNANLVLDTTWYRGADRKFAINELNIIYKANIKNELLMKAVLAILKPRVVKNEENFLKTVVQSGEHVFLDGYWDQNTKHLNSLEESARKEFTIKNPSENFLKYSREISKGSISIHVRRGDILPEKNVFLPQNKSYYENAIENVMKDKKISNPQITIFSDDVPWCKENLDYLKGIKTFVFDDSSVSDMEQLILMSLYDHNIIANSTFSWWAAVLNKNPDKYIVAPAQWFKSKKFEAGTTYSLVLPGWKTCE
jgi:hypothetical protein